MAGREIVWLVAAVAPSAVAPHPNFPEPEIDGPQRFALTTSLRLGEKAQHKEVRYVHAWERTLTEVAWQSLSRWTQRQAADGLRVLLDDEAIPLAARAAAALFAGVAYSELDEGELAIEGLQKLVRHCEGVGPETKSDPSLVLLICALRQGLTLRLAELGKVDEATAEADRILELSQSIDQNLFDDFQVSRGISWSAQQVQADVLQALRAYALEWKVRRGGPTTDLWQTVVRSRPLWLDVASERLMVRSLTALVDERFDHRMEAVKPQSVRFGPDRIDGPIGRSLLLAEITGDVSATQDRREKLGRIRASSRGPGSVAEVFDGLRLLRQSGKHDLVATVVRAIRVDGPTGALLDSATTILRRFSVEIGTNRSELTILAGAADLLEDEDVERSIDIALGYRRQARDPGLGSSAVLPWARGDFAWRTVSQLVASIGTSRKVALEALLDVQAPDCDESVIRRVAGILQDIDWQNIGDDVVAGWSEWAKGNLDRPGGEDAIDVLFEALPKVFPAQRRHLHLNGRRLVRRLLFDQDRGIPPQFEQLAEAEGRVEDSLSAVRAKASRGQYGFGSSNAGALAAVMVSRLGAHSLWSSLVDFLADPSVQSEDKNLAFDVLAREAPPLPEAVRTEILQKRGTMLNVTDSHPWEGDISHSYSPAAVRFLCAHGLVDAELTMRALSELMGSGSALAKADAASSLKFAISITGEAWPQGMLLNLSYDSDSTVRAEVARTIPFCLSGGSPLSSVLIDRVREFLRSDGLLVPLRALQGLRDAEIDYSSLRDDLEQLTSSQSRTVRRMACDLTSRL